MTRQNNSPNIVGSQTRVLRVRVRVRFKVGVRVRVRVINQVKGYNEGNGEG
jgi:hypothetical protein